MYVIYNKDEDTYLDYINAGKIPFRNRYTIGMQFASYAAAQMALDELINFNTDGYRIYLVELKLCP